MYFPLSALEMSCLALWLKEWAIFHAYCICWREVLVCLKARKIRYIFKSKSIREIDIDGYHRTTFLHSLILIGLPVFFRVKHVLLPLEGVENILRFPLMCIGNVWQKVDIYFFFFNCLCQRKTKQKIR